MMRGRREAVRGGGKYINSTYSCSQKVVGGKMDIGIVKKDERVDFMLLAKLIL